MANYFDRINFCEILFCDFANFRFFRVWSSDRQIKSSKSLEPVKIPLNLSDFTQNKSIFHPFAKFSPREILQTNVLAESNPKKFTIFDLAKNKFPRI